MSIISNSDMLRQISDAAWALKDHAGGFDQNLSNTFLDQLPFTPCRVICEYRVDRTLQDHYPKIRFEFDHEFKQTMFRQFEGYKQHPMLLPKHFIASFNGSAHVSRKLLVSALYCRGWFDPATCSKNFAFSVDTLDGHLVDHVCDNTRLYRKFFLSGDIENFCKWTHNFGYERYDHKSNIYNLQQALTSSFLHLVSETLATSHYPFVTEKFLYSIVTRGLFLSYAQPGWHKHLEHYYGFLPYTKIFDYSFDLIENPIHRLTALLCMLSRFASLNTHDWTDLQEMEKHTIEHNYDLYMSGDYLRFLQPDVIEKTKII